MLPEAFFEVLRHEGVLAIATYGSELHLVNSWNSYVQVTDGDTLVIPVGGMRKTESNVAVDHRVLITAGAREVVGKQGRPGTGFLIAGKAEFLSSGEEFDLVKEKFPWARAALKVTVQSVTQTL